MWTRPGLSRMWLPCQCSLLPSLLVRLTPSRLHHRDTGSHKARKTLQAAASVEAAGTRNLRAGWRQVPNEESLRGRYCESNQSQRRGGGSIFEYLINRRATHARLLARDHNRTRPAARRRRARQGAPSHGLPWRPANGKRAAVPSRPKKFLERAEGRRL